MLRKQGMHSPPKIIPNITIMDDNGYPIEDSLQNRNLSSSMLLTIHDIRGDDGNTFLTRAKSTTERILYESERKAEIPSIKYKQAIVLQRIAEIGANTSFKAQRQQTLSEQNQNFNGLNTTEGNPYDNEGICRIDYNFSGLRTRHVRSVLSKKGQQMYQTASDTSKLLRNRHLAVRHHADGPSLDQYSLEAQEQDAKTKVRTQRSVKISEAPLVKCDFFYPMAVKDPENLPEAYHIIQAKQSYTSLNQGTPAYSFGKNTHRDQNSHMKDIIRVLNSHIILNIILLKQILSSLTQNPIIFLNERKSEIDKAKRERMRIHTIGQFQLEEEMRRNANSMLPSVLFFFCEQMRQIQQNSQMTRNYDIQVHDKGGLAKNSEIVVPLTIKEGREFRQDMINNIRDREFQLKGVIKNSFGNIAQKYQTLMQGTAPTHYIRANFSNLVKKY